MKEEIAKAMGSHYGYYLCIAVILFSTKLFGLITKKMQLPQVVGALVAGLLLGPACFGIVEDTKFIDEIAGLGVVVLMFSAGLETDIKELKKTGLASFVIALFGVAVPLGAGWGIAAIFNTEQGEGLSSLMYQNIFIGVILTATSVSITVETLKEMGKLSTKSGNAILGAAVIDDILGIIALTVIMSVGGNKSGAAEGPSIGIVLLKIVLFFVFAILVSIAFNFLYNKWTGRSKRDLRRYVIIAFVFCLFMSFCAEYFFDVADITGAFVAGLALSNGTKAEYLTNRFSTLSYMFLSPIFFASIGLAVVLPDMNMTIILFSVVLLIVAILTKVIGCGIGAKFFGYSNKDCLRIGVGMISRGEVALIVANKGKAVGLIKDEYLAPIVIVVVVTTIVTPILLKLVYKKKHSNDEGKGELDINKFRKDIAIEAVDQKQAGGSPEEQ